MVEKKTRENKDKIKVKTTKAKPSKTKSKSTKSKNKKVIQEPFADAGVVIVDENIEFDQEKLNEERRAYLEEARSQDASD